MEEFNQEIVDNIKHEPEAHFTCYLPEIPESDEELEVKEVKIVLRKFDKTWKSSPELFKSYFACEKCEYAYKQSGNLERHLKVCETLKKCEDCRLKRKSEKIIKCVFCHQQFNCSNCRTIHISQAHHNNSSWHCSKCDYKTPNNQCLRLHYQIHVKKFLCQTCKQNFSHNQRLINHQQQHRHGEHATRPVIKYDCTACIKSFATKTGMRKHERSVHSKHKFHCDVCGKTTKAKWCLRQHMQIHQKLSCPICHHFLAERLFQNHIDKHSTTPSFECDDCDKVYFNQNDLNIHKIRKHKIEQVQCDLCNKIFKNKILLRYHMQHHLKISCPTCSRSMSKTSLNRHMKIHLSA